MTSLNVPNAITNGTVADATDVQQNFDAIETHVNTEMVNRDGSIAMTGELLLPSNPTSNLAASTKSYVDGKDSAMNTRVAALEGKDIVITLTGDVTGTGTITNLGDVSFVTTVVDDSHNHLISNVDGLQTALDGKLGLTAKAADSDLLDSLNSTQFLRSDADDSTNSNLTVGGVGKYLKLSDSSAGTEVLTLATSNMTANQTITFPNATGTVALTSSSITGNAATATTATSAGKWSTARTITLAGGATGSVSIDGSANVTLTATVANSSHAHGAVTRIFVQAGTPSGASTNDLWIDT